MDRDGRVVGSHGGSHLFTIGQRKRIRITDPRPYFVTDIDSAQNVVTIGREEDLLREEMTVRRFNWLLNPRLGTAAVKIRSRHAKTPAEILSIEGDTVRVRFLSPQKAVTPGQAAVFYDGGDVIGGGWIE